MKILVADDELIMLESLCRILEKEEGMTVETARTGREAIEKAEVFHPDLVMMDIKMPGINGLEALSEIRRLSPSAIFVILSAYNNFAYAQEAIKLNVFSYLVKPVNKRSLLEVVFQVRERLQQIKAERQEELGLREKYKKILPLIESEFLHALVNGISSSEFYDYQKLLGVEFNAGFFLALLRHENAPFLDDGEYTYQVREYMAFLSDSLRHLFPCFVGPLKTNPITIFVPLTINGGGYEETTPKTYAEKILIHLHSIGEDRGIVVGVGAVYSDPIMIRHSYYEALQALNRSGADDCLIYYSDLPKSAGFSWEEQLLSLFQAVWDALSFGNYTKVQIALDKIRSLLPQISEAHHDRLLFDLLLFYLTAYRLALKSSAQGLFEPSYARLCAIFQPDKNMKEVYSLISADIKLMAAAVKETREKKIKAIIQEAKTIIDQDYTKHITLEELANTVKISSYYLSRLFKEEVGENFSEYLTRLRMEKTIQLLAEGLPVKECCFMVGYNDPNYFSRIFKKYYGVAPTDYQVGKGISGDKRAQRKN